MEVTDGLLVAGQIIGGEHGEILIRQRSGQQLELGDLLMAREELGPPGTYTVVQVFQLQYGSQIPKEHLEMMSGMQLEGYGGSMEFMEQDLRSYVLASVKALIVVEPIAAGGFRLRVPKHLPPFFGCLRRVTREDLRFLERPANPVLLGHVRSGSRVLDAPVYLDAVEMFSHHVLIPATTGRGKSNLVKVMLHSTLSADRVGVLVLDPHDEYYGRSGPGLKDHPEARSRLAYYSPVPPKGGLRLQVNLTLIRPAHLRGILELSDAQWQAVWTLYHKQGPTWIEAIFARTGDELEAMNIRSDSVGPLRRKLRLAFDLRETDDGMLVSRNEVFVTRGGETTVKGIVDHLELGHKVIIDTSRLSNAGELLIGSIIANQAFLRYRDAKGAGTLEERPVLTFVVEEAPRVLGGGTEEPNIFGTIAREGRKFRIGITAITQLCSMIPREIRANLNTKIILGNEMSEEREAIIASAAQDLSRDGAMIAALDRGEAIVTSVFTKFAIPIQVPLFDELVRTVLPEAKRPRHGFVG